MKETAAKDRAGWTEVVCGLDIGLLSQID